MLFPPGLVVDRRRSSVTDPPLNPTNHAVEIASGQEADETLQCSSGDGHRLGSCPSSVPAWRTEGSSGRQAVGDRLGLAVKPTFRH